ncbi:hypothetical protein [Bradyrhizobium sp. CCBAU 051011]|jgi:hypothetical protein|uniref:hypothetical protein n=1 Tax=Bradyrhizobium sp. CCBAU 051011 TaxID=858422 RepID=UPI001379C1B6|nr:hypothetical protein [Bradyrhizobium sp. CCBAU 051011]
MDIAELQRILSDRGVRPRAFSVEGIGADHEQYRLERSGGVWRTYYYERGNMNALREFPDEDEACRYFLEVLLNDPTTRR